MTTPKQILVLGGGFAGLWSAVGAARQLDQLGGTEAVRVTLINRDAFYCIRVRCYEADLSSIRVPLDDVLAQWALSASKRMWKTSIVPAKR